jgi:hypothetical protein
MPLFKFSLERPEQGVSGIVKTILVVEDYHVVLGGLFTFEQDMQGGMAGLNAMPISGLVQWKQNPDATATFSCIKEENSETIGAQCVTPWLCCVAVNGPVETLLKLADDRMLVGGSFSFSTESSPQYQGNLIEIALGGQYVTYGISSFVPASYSVDGSVLSSVCLARNNDTKCTRVAVGGSFGAFHNYSADFLSKECQTNPGKDCIKASKLFDIPMGVLELDIEWDPASSGHLIYPSAMLNLSKISHQSVPQNSSVRALAIVNGSNRQLFIGGNISTFGNVVSIGVEERVVHTIPRAPLQSGQSRNCDGPGVGLFFCCTNDSICPAPGLAITCPPESGLYCLDAHNRGNVGNVTSCPSGSYCPTSAESLPCTAQHYCPEATIQPLACSSMMITFNACGDQSQNRPAMGAQLLAVLVCVVGVALALFLVAKWVVKNRGAKRDERSKRWNQGFDDQLCTLAGSKAEPLLADVAAAEIVLSASTTSCNTSTSSTTLPMPAAGGLAIQIPDEAQIDLGFTNLGVLLADGKTRVLEGVTGIVRAKRVTAIMGPSGAGKTTLLSALSNRIVGGTVTGSFTGEYTCAHVREICFT